MTRPYGLAPGFTGAWGLTAAAAAAILAALAGVPCHPATVPLAVAETTAATSAPEGTPMTLHRPDGPAPIDASLHLLADHLVDTLAAGDLEPAMLHVSAGDAEGFELGLRPLDGLHPSELLLGFTAPDDWHALGTAVGGSAFHVTERDDPEPARTPVHLVTLVSRTGEIAHRMRAGGGDGPDIPETVLAETPSGEQIDLLRLALGLPTDPPPCGADVYWSIGWLSQLLAAPRHQLSRWRDVAELHPAAVLSGQAPRGDRLPDPGVELVELARACTRVLTWSRLRRVVQEGSLPVAELSPEEAAWFDDGAFARYVLNRCPSLAGLRRRVDRHLPRPLARRVAATLDELGVPVTAWPDDAGDAAA